ncbi:hypothetical protein M3O96_12180 [Aquiflexum sp. TKW24L]|uniref:hypothetical protein n=1 Tax=Aquiflexum sp. TKW24L TaxID=2942212 RepID=UPI0020BF6F6D|nr:hypothetical protein [Aquiflexum sp. TKW24L]MCL6259852.1 hypothetical protein [Aquiflexum sp. TKW24L]
MKKILFFAIFAFAAACSPATKITRSWTSPDKYGGGYSNLYVAAIIGDVTKRQTIEDDVRSKLSTLGIRSTTSSATIRPNFWMSTDLDKNAMMNIVNQNGQDGIMTMTLIDVQDEQRYIPGAMMMGGPMMMGGGWGMGGNFGGHWGMNHGMMMTPGHIVNDRKYFIEINMYDVKSELLVWSAQSKTLNPTSMEKFSSEFAQVVLERMLEEGVIRKQ